MKSALNLAHQGKIWILTRGVKYIQIIWSVEWIALCAVQKTKLSELTRKTVSTNIFYHALTLEVHCWPACDISLVATADH